MAKLNASKFTNRDILVTGVDPSTGEYLSAAQRKALFRKKKISSNQVFRKPGALVKVGSSAITSDVDVNVLNVRVVAVEKQVSFLAKALDKEAELEKKGQKEREKELLRQEEKQLRSGKEKQLEKGLSKTLLAPVKGVGRAAKGILGNLMELFGVLFAGWLTDKGWKAIAANATGDIGTLEEIKKNVIDALLKVGGIFLAINGGLFVALKLLKKITKKIGGFVWRNTFGKLFSALNPFKKPNAAANAAGAAANAAGAGVDAATTKPKPKPTVDADDLTDAQKLAKKKLAQEVVDRGLSAKGAMVGGKYLSVDAAEAAELLKPKKVGFFQRIKNVAGNIGSGISNLAKKGAGAIKAGLKKLIAPIIAPFANKAKGLANKVLSAVQKLPGYSKIASFLQKQGLGTVKNVAGGGKKLGAKALPFIGGIANLLFAYDRLAGKDSIGAALETISAILDFSGAFPLSLGLDAFLFARDFVPGIKGGEDALLGKLGLTGMIGTLNELGGKLPNLGELVGPLFGKKPEQPEPTEVQQKTDYQKWLMKTGKPDDVDSFTEFTNQSSSPGFSPPSGPAPKAPAAAPSIASPSSPQMQAPGPVTSSGNTTVIYKKVGGGGQSQQQSMKSGSATDVPLIASANPDNFYTMYSQLIYNVVN